MVKTKINQCKIYFFSKLIYNSELFFDNNFFNNEDFPFGFAVTFSFKI